MNKELKDKLVTLIAVATSDERYYWGRVMEGEDHFEGRHAEARAYLKGVHAVLDTLSDLPPEPTIFSKEYDDKLKSKLDELNIEIDFSK
jgi:hypothetical protein